MKNILVVDNDKIFLMLMRRLLEKDGHQVETAGDGLDALDILKAYTPDVIFVDLVMPNIDGRTLCRIIRGMEKLKNIPIIILSATSAEELTDFSQLDVNACIAKGTFNETAQHVLSVLNQSNLASCRCLIGDVVGIKNVYPRGITKELLSVKKHFEIMLDRMSEGILEINLEGRIVYVNSAALTLIDILEKDLLGSYFVDLFSGDDHQRIYDLMKIEGAKSKTITEDAPVRLNRFQVTLNIIPLGKDESTYIIILHDVTERKKSEEALQKAHDELERRVEERTAELSLTNEQLMREIKERKKTEEALRESEEKYCNLSEGTFEAVVWHDKGKIIEANEQYYEMFGYKPEELAGKDAILFTATPDSVEFMREQISLGHLGPYEVVGMKKDGTEFPMEIRAKNMKYKGRMARMAAIRDLTERKQAEEYLHKYERIVAASNDHLSLIDRNYVYQVVNDAYLRSHNVKREDIVGHSVPELFGQEFFERHQKSMIDRCLAGEVARYQTWTDFPTLGRRYMDIVHYPYFEDDGSISGYVVNAHDITERKQAEEEREKLINELQEAIKEIKTLRGILNLLLL